MDSRKREEEELEGEGAGRLNSSQESQGSQCVLDTTVYPEDYVSKLFHDIDWSSRVQKPRSEQQWLESESWDRNSYTCRYLQYQCEEGQIDLDNPFHIEESNLARTRLFKKTKRRKEGEEGGAELSLVTEGIKEIGSKEGEDSEDDYMDEYGNIKEDKPKVVKDKPVKESKNEMKKSKGKQEKSRKHPHKPPTEDKRSAPKWRDYDNVKDDLNTASLAKCYQNPREEQQAALSVVSTQIVFPRLSSLSWREQEIFLQQLELARQGRLAELPGHNLQQYHNMVELVQEEQQEFRSFAREVFSYRCPPLEEDLLKYATEYRAARMRRLQEQLPRWWDRLKEIRCGSV